MNRKKKGGHRDGGGAKEGKEVKSIKGGGMEGRGKGSEGKVWGQRWRDVWGQRGRDVWGQRGRDVWRQRGREVWD